MNKLINDNIEQLRSALKEHFIKEAYLFGSATTDRFNENSDIDLLISFKKIPFDGYAENLWNLEDQLESIFGRRVDLLPDHTLKNPYFIREINKNKLKVYG
ncbi:MAG: nucleotidyltransferase domain-containing protein [Cyclobacteriaceae bacterium]|nr:nucleotidyltransferase domain-containing protein [Cyclobacteriaceae bacterium]MCK5469134.1 nucleotidyltransferase domain-containing protein [Cyclobacteriaceae bacterium]